MANLNTAERERQFNDSIGGTMAKFMVAVVDADSISKRAYTQNQIELLREPNVEFATGVGIIGGEQELQVRTSVPVIAVTNNNPIEVQEATISMDMTVHENQTDTFSLASKTDAKAGFSAGFGLVKIGGSISSSVSVSKDKSRESDYSSKTHAEVKMVQGKPPEGLAIILEAQTSLVKTAMQINSEIAKTQAVKLQQEDGIANPASISPLPDSANKQAEA